MKRPWLIATVFTLCLAILLVAMGWVSWTVLELQHAETDARREAVLEERVRLALWRMDSALGVLIARESGRPYFVYRSHVSATLPYNRLFDVSDDGTAERASPLLTEDTPYVLLHFQVEPFGTLTSPQVPERGALAQLGASRGFGERLNELRSRVSPEWVRSTMASTGEAPAIQRIAAAPQDEVARQQSSQMLINAAERQARSRVSRQAQRQDQQRVMPPEPWLRGIDEDLFRPVWREDMLLLLRQVRVGREPFVQGCWLDWNAIQVWLEREVADLLPDVRFEPVLDNNSKESTRTLATIPVRLVPGQTPVEVPVGSSPIRFTLFVAWGCVVVAIVAVGVLLVGTLALSERRAAFVSAVTHEMRTPLTTFRLYTDSLKRGIVTDEKKRSRYIDTLSAEAGRLGHLIENVLAYARLERHRPQQRAEPTTLDALLERIQPQLTGRAQLAGMELNVDADASVLDARVAVVTSLVEQILVNLVDNACKYAACADPPTIRLDIEVRGDRALLCVRDYGPGIAPASVRRVFQPFNKSSAAAAETAPGIGLGLALSRRLARSLGGDLILDASWTQGAGFELSLPVAS